MPTLILVGGGCAPPVPKNRRRRRGVGRQNIFFKDFRKISFYPQNNFRMTFLVIDRKLPENRYTPKMPSAARR